MGLGLEEKRGTDKGCFRGSPARELEGGPFHRGEQRGTAKACISRTRAVESLGQILCLAPDTYSLIYIFKLVTHIFNSGHQPIMVRAKAVPSTSNSLKNKMNEI